MQGGARVDPDAPPLHVLYLLTTFPVLSETFVQREIRILRGLPVNLKLYSLWGGGTRFKSIPINRFPKWKLITLIWWLPYWLCKRRGVFVRLCRDLREKKLPSPADLGTTFIGIGFALCTARRFSRFPHRPDIIHAAWATMPATAAQVLSKLVGIPFTFQANAYDLFRNGGDWLLPGKLRDTALVITSTEYAKSALLASGLPASRVVVARRGLDVMPQQKSMRPARIPLRILSVGRLVEKKGYLEQLEILAYLKSRGFRFEACIAGGGPMEKAIRQRLTGLGLTGLVGLTGPLPYESVAGCYHWADVFLFTGKVASNGDRDGFPNVLGEAMAFGVPVLSTPVSGVPEAIDDGDSGFLLDPADHGRWHDTLARLQEDDEIYLRASRGGRAWACANFDAGKNTGRIYGAFRAVAGGSLALPAADKAAVRPGGPV